MHLVVGAVRTASTGLINKSASLFRCSSKGSVAMRMSSIELFMEGLFRN